jgi:hypothetical protein
MKHTSRLLLMAALALACFAVSAAPPEGWYMAGSKPGNYDSGTDAVNSYNSKPSAFMKAKADGDGFGTLMQNFAATQYKGKRVRMSAWVKSEGVSRWAGLWMRIDGPAGANGPQQLGFDNMQNRAIKGTTYWQKYEVVLDVPEAAVGIFFGILQDGPGQVWMNSVEFSVVGKEVPTTSAARSTPDGPQNLTLEK